METSGVAYRSVPRLPATGARFVGRFSRELNPGVGDSRVCAVVIGSRKYYMGGRLSCQFSDSGHTQYYVSPRGSLAKKKDKEKEKKGEIKRAKSKLKFIERLSKDLSMLPRMAADGEDQDLLGIGLVGQVNATMISEASEVLLAQLKQLRSEQKELKRKLKLERAQLKAAMEKSESSSSSSSESSSDCDGGEVVDMTSLRNNALKQPEEIEEALSNINSLKQPEEMEAVRTVTESATLAHSFVEKEDMANSLLELANSDSTPQIRVRVPGFEDEQSNSLVEGSAMKKIEICMGGKCKKLGAAALFEEFERKVGAEASVVGCKCMGKCKTAPNVRVRNSSSAGAEGRSVEDSVKLGINPTCTGVGLQDVDLIVANLLGKGINDEYLVLSS